MLIFFTILGAAYLFMPGSSIHFIDIPSITQSDDFKYDEDPGDPESTTVSSSSVPEIRRFLRQSQDAMKKIDEEHDKNLKTKISILVQQTIHDTTKKIEAIQQIKAENRDKVSYKAGFLINLVKKSKDVVNELFSVGVKHKDDWKALEQMKTYELLVHANVDTDNLVKQLVDIHTSASKKDKTL
ncbi:uncharacterized protein LOC128672961 [Plodia interpunctella]|uniref:uncharacterized protein LOC128672961 n=1 Tax=Plodia interpunctella TaxID=58824 RepID=UPI002367B056|nr:uncharacterized protein LOC128672961 [Plodia interpunctella]